MRLHRSLVEAVVESLKDIFIAGKYADKVIEKVLKSNPKWGARDRAFIAENIYDIVRYWRLMAFATDSEGREIKRIWHIVGAWFISQGIQLPDWTEFSMIDAATVKRRGNEGQQEGVLAESIPDWLNDLGKKELGKDWFIELPALNDTAPVTLRTNTLKTDLKNLKFLLDKEGIQTDALPDTPTALVLKERKPLFASPNFKNGLFEIQDAGSQWIAPMLDVKAGMRVIDACAGAGGKTLHLSALMENKGSLIAMDIENHKLEEMRRRASRAGAANIESRLIESTKTIKRLHDSADRLLLDVPCSGLGVLRRNPDAKWKLSMEFIEKVKLTQRDILDRYSKMLRKDGKMVYATCSILPSESEEQVAWFLAQQEGAFELLSEKRCSPAKNGYDGFYMACLKKVV